MCPVSRYEAWDVAVELVLRSRATSRSAGNTAAVLVQCKGAEETRGLLPRAQIRRIIEEPCHWPGELFGGGTGRRCSTGPVTSTARRIRGRTGLLPLQVVSPRRYRPGGFVVIFLSEFAILPLFIDSPDSLRLHSFIAPIAPSQWVGGGIPRLLRSPRWLLRHLQRRNNRPQTLTHPHLRRRRRR